MENMLNFEYRVSIVIPVYNAEEYLEECLDSLLAQTISQEEMEVVMVVDGSPDGSLGVCLRYALEHSNFKVITQENKGVSAARNKGIQNSKGKYIMYLDGDDMLSPEAVKSVVDFFDTHYDETDVVTYPLVYCRENGRSDHWHNRYMKETGVFNLEKFPYICQSTINVCVKAEKSPLLFDTTIKLAEDQTYICQSLLKKGTMGIVAEGQYFYRKYAGSTTRETDHAYYNAENLMLYFEHLVAWMKQYPYMKYYLGALIVYNLSMHISTDSLYPYHYGAMEIAQYKNRLSEVLNHVDTMTIYNYPMMDVAHKFYLLFLKTQCPLSTSLCKNQVAVVESLPPVIKDGHSFLASQVIHAENKVLIVMSQTRIFNDKLYILAYLKNMAFAFMEKPQLFAVIDDQQEEEVTLFPSQYSCYKTKIQTNLFWAFHFEIDLQQIEKFYFKVRLRNLDIETKYWFNNKGILPRIGRNFLIGESYGVLFRKNKFYSMNCQSKEFRKVQWQFEWRLLRENRKQWLARRYMSVGKKGPIWLYSDAYHTVDNGYIQFQHDFGKQDGITRYYVCKKDNIDWKTLFTPEQYPYLIERDSRQHKKLFAQADKVLASFVDRSSYVPFDAATIAYYWDLFHAEVTYLQHGVMHAQLFNMYSKEKVYLVDKIVASTHFEQETFMNKLAFRPQDVLCCGMPRLDQLMKSAQKKKILFAPSWRLYLVSKNGGGWSRRFNFASSDYFQEVRIFLTDPNLLDALDKSGYCLDIKLHPNFSAYESDFRSLESSHVTVVSQVELHTYVGCITDISSYMYDLFYLGIPVFTHIFDHDRFKSGLHSYRELSWPMEDEYPLYRSDQGELVELLVQFMNNPATITEKFNKYVEGMFFSCDGGHAETLYQELMKGKK